MAGRDDLEDRLRQSVGILQQDLGEALLSVVLFGSRARERCRPDSDVDLLVLVSSLPADPHALRARVREGLGHPVDVCWFTPQDLRENFRMAAPLVSTLVLGLRVIYDRGGTFRRAFRRFLPTLTRSGRRYVEGDTLWELHALARGFARSHASSLEPLITT